MSNLFDFEILPVESRLHIGLTKLLAINRWDNIYYRGQLQPGAFHVVRCIQPCPGCYQNWFNLTLRDFRSNLLDDLVMQGYLTPEIIEKKQMAHLSSLEEKHLYQTALECPAHYVQVHCNQCRSRFLMILGLTETLPGLYTGQLQGMWRVNERNEIR